jgi:nitrile hydratase accessory protein
MTACLSSPLPAAPLPEGLPRDEAGPVFREPWEARAFALAVRLHEAGHFTWGEWADALSAEIRAAAKAGDPDTGDTYYRHWLRALEGLLARKGLLAPGDLEGRIAPAGAPGHHDHHNEV